MYRGGPLMQKWKKLIVYMLQVPKGEEDLRKLR